jgi:class 3 adenylate cyclase
VTCARAMQHGLTSLNEQWAKRGLPALSQRIGIHQGTAVVGNFGSEKRSDYTCIGSAVNLASRIETACEVGQVYVSQSIHELLPDESEEAGQFELKGIEGKTSLYKLVVG